MDFKHTRGNCKLNVFTLIDKASAGLYDNLYLNHYELSDIPELSQVKQPKKLLLSYNKIESIPKSFPSLWSSSLVLLDLSYNCIKELPSSIGKRLLPTITNNIHRKTNEFKGARVVKQ